MEKYANKPANSSGPRMGDSDWICPDVDCGNINFSRRNSCNICGRERADLKMKKKMGTEIGKSAADKSRGLFSADDWQCNKCANVNWARRQTCNVCCAPKFGEVEARTGYGGGYNERGVIEYRPRRDSDDDEFDEFGRRKKRKSRSGGGDSEKVTETQAARSLIKDSREESLQRRQPSIRDTTAHLSDVRSAQGDYKRASGGGEKTRTEPIRHSSGGEVQSGKDTLKHSSSERIVKDNKNLEEESAVGKDARSDVCLAVTRGTVSAETRRFNKKDRSSKFSVEGSYTRRNYSEERIARKREHKNDDTFGKFGSSKHAKIPLANIRPIRSSDTLYEPMDQQRYLKPNERNKSLTPRECIMENQVSSTNDVKYRFTGKTIDDNFEVVYTLEERVTAACWAIIYQNCKISAEKFQHAFDKPAPDFKTIFAWRQRLLLTGCLVDKHVLAESSGSKEPKRNSRNKKRFNRRKRARYYEHRGETTESSSEEEQPQKIVKRIFPSLKSTSGSDKVIVLNVESDEEIPNTKGDDKSKTISDRSNNNSDSDKESEIISKKDEIQNLRSPEKDKMNNDGKNSDSYFTDVARSVTPEMVNTRVDLANFAKSPIPIEAVETHFHEDIYFEDDLPVKTQIIKDTNIINDKFLVPEVPKNKKDAKTVEESLKNVLEDIISESERYTSDDGSSDSDFIEKESTDKRSGEDEQKRCFREHVYNKNSKMDTVESPPPSYDSKYQPTNSAKSKAIDLPLPQFWEQQKAKVPSSEMQGPTPTLQAKPMSSAIRRIYESISSQSTNNDPRDESIMEYIPTKIDPAMAKRNYQMFKNDMTIESIHDIFGDIVPSNKSSTTSVQTDGLSSLKKNKTIEITSIKCFGRVNKVEEIPMPPFKIQKFEDYHPDEDALYRDTSSDEMSDSTRLKTPPRAPSIGSLKAITEDDTRSNASSVRKRENYSNRESDRKEKECPDYLQCEDKITEVSTKDSSENDSNKNRKTNTSKESVSSKNFDDYSSQELPEDDGVDEEYCHTKRAPSKERMNSEDVASGELKMVCSTPVDEDYTEKSNDRVANFNGNHSKREAISLTENIGNKSVSEDVKKKTNIIIGDCNQSNDCESVPSEAKQILKTASIPETNKCVVKKPTDNLLSNGKGEEAVNTSEIRAKSIEPEITNVVQTKDRPSDVTVKPTTAAVQLDASSLISLLNINLTNFNASDLVTALQNIQTLALAAKTLTPTETKEKENPIVDEVKDAEVEINDVIEEEKDDVIILDASPLRKKVPTAPDNIPFLSDMFDPGSPPREKTIEIDKLPVPNILDVQEQNLDDLLDLPKPIAVTGFRSFAIPKPIMLNRLRSSINRQQNAEIKEANSSDTVNVEKKRKRSKRSSPSQGNKSGGEEQDEDEESGEEGDLSKYDLWGSDDENKDKADRSYDADTVISADVSILARVRERLNYFR